MSSHKSETGIVFKRSSFDGMMASRQYFQAALHAAAGDGQRPDDQNLLVRGAVEKAASLGRSPEIKAILDSVLIAPYLTDDDRDRLQRILDEKPKNRRKDGPHNGRHGRRAA